MENKSLRKRKEKSKTAMGNYLQWERNALAQRLYTVAGYHAPSALPLFNIIDKRIYPSVHSKLCVLQQQNSQSSEISVEPAEQEIHEHPSPDITSVETFADISDVCIYFIFAPISLQLYALNGVLR